MKKIFRPITIILVTFLMLMPAFPAGQVQAAGSYTGEFTAFHKLLDVKINKTDDRFPVKMTEEQYRSASENGMIKVEESTGQLVRTAEGDYEKSTPGQLLLTLYGLISFNKMIVTIADGQVSGIHYDYMAPGYDVVTQVSGRVSLSGSTPQYYLTATQRIEPKKSHLSGDMTISANFTTDEKQKDAIPSQPYNEAPPAEPAAAQEEISALESISIVPARSFLNAGETVQLNVAAVPADAPLPEVTVKNYDNFANAIIMDDHALVTALSPGYASVMGQTKDGKLSAKAEVFVMDPRAYAVIVSMTAAGVRRQGSQQLEPVFVGDFLYPGDVLQTHLAGKAGDVYAAETVTVEDGLGFSQVFAKKIGLLKLPTGKMIMRFAAPPAGEPAAEEAGVLSGPAKNTGDLLSDLWAKTKKFLSGESFEVKTPTATCGVRG